MTEMAPLTRVPCRVKLRVEDYLALDDAGAFDAYGKTELLDGEVVYMNAQHRPHGRVKMAIYDALREALSQAGSALTVLVEVSVALAEHDTPEPDLTLTSEPGGDGLIPGRSVALVIEVADATLASDMTRKAAIYARAGVPEYWVADVSGRIVHQMWLPVADAYTLRHEVGFGAPLASATLSDLTLDTSKF